MFDIDNQDFGNSTAQWNATLDFNPGTLTSGANSNVLGSADNSSDTFNNGMISSILSPSYNVANAFTTNDANNSLDSSGNTPFASFDGVNSNTLSSLDNTQTTTAIIEANKQLMSSMEQNQKLQESLKTQSEQHEKTVTELQEKIATLEKEKETLTNQKSTLQRECLSTRHYINMLRGFYDFRIGIDGKLLPLVPETDTIALIAQGAPATPLQAGYEQYLKEMISGHHEQTRRANIAAAGQRILKADLCHLCPVHNGPEANLHPSRVTPQPTPTIDLTVDAPSAPASLHQQAVKAARAALQANVTNTPVGASTQAATQVNDSVVAVAPAESEASETPSAAPAQADTEANAATASVDRPAPPETPPASPEGTESSLPKREKKDRSYSWLPKSQNLALLKAQGMIKDQFEQKKVEDELRLARRAASHAEILAMAASTSAAASTSTLTAISQPAIPSVASSAARATVTNTKKTKAASRYKNNNSTVLSSKASKVTKPKAPAKNRIRTAAATSISASTNTDTTSKQKKSRAAQLEKSAFDQLDMQPARQAGPTASKMTTSSSTTEATTTTEPRKYYYDDLSDAEDLEDNEPAYDQLEIIDHNLGDKIAPLSAGDIDMGEMIPEEDPLDDLFEGEVPLMADSDGEISEEE
ncbi:hypothetical protein G647_05971 [Cladophialophora carrionii CBS 160.54]|uniref:Uncharacterized protein n=1 Tax=Cladophialophora carrionii CBS 160.54 TaxID=1279043 RepID=V9D5I9_9EURO|nr:uncharacterized protein G647_05971 [Cladophialophora carrionii CBS 160.54]ETI21901.1 hypothetical protein G647_05971 [Cladophialophora carrionii CBS 160.54]